MTGAGTRVVYVCLDPGIPVFGGKGCSVHVQEVLRVLVASGADVHLVTTRVGGQAPRGLESVRIHDLGRPRGEAAAREVQQQERDRQAADLVEELLREEGSAIVYERYSLFACAVAERCRERGVPHVLEVNSPLVEEHAAHRDLRDVAGAEERSRRVLRASFRVLAVSSAVAAFVAASAGVTARVVPNGVDVDRFRPAPSTRFDEPDAADFTIAFVGAFRPWHGVELLVEAAGVLAGLPGDPVRLVLVGDGPGRPAALERVRELGIPCEAPGSLAPEDVPGALAGVRAAVAPYPRGAAYFSPLKVAEYLAAGVPTVAGAVGDLGRLYQDGTELLLVEPGDLEALVAALQRLRTEPGLAGELARAGRSAAVQRFSWSRTVEVSLQGLLPARTEVLV